MYAICQRNKEKLNQVGDAFGIEKRYTDYDELLKDKNIDAVHINTPIQNHAEQSIKALRAESMWPVQCHGYYSRRMQADSGSGKRNRTDIYDDGNGSV